MQIDPSRYIIIALAVWMLTGCYSRTEGCLDTYGSNYDVSVDDSCPNCCEYPFLKLVVLNRFGDSLYVQGDTLTNQFGQQYIILGLRYYVSHFRLFQSGNELAIKETIQNDISGYSIPDDIKISKETDTNLNIGMIRTYGKFDSLQFTMGISDEFLDNSFTNLPVNHVLQKLYRLNDADGNQASVIVKYRLLTPIDTTINITINPSFKIQYTIRDSLNITQPGRPITGKVIADYKKLMDNIDLIAPSDQIKDRLVKNLSNLLIVK